MFEQRDLDNVDKARVALTEMIVWDLTEEGSEFWIDIHARMDRIYNNIELHLKPQAPVKL